MKNTRFFRLFCGLLAVLSVLLIALVSCADDGEEVPENMQIATLSGSSYRLYIPIDWNVMTETGVSGGYASMTDIASATVHRYENPDCLSLDTYLKDVYLPSLAEAYSPDGIAAEDSAAASLGGEDALIVAYQGTRNLVTYRGADILCFHEGCVYALSLVAMQDTFEEYNDDFSAIRSNFVFSDIPYDDGSSIDIPEDITAPAGMKLASTDDVAYRFFVPENWCQDTARPTSSVYYSEEDRTNVSVTVYMPSESQLSADEYWAQCQKELSAVYGTISYSDVISETELDGRSAKIYRYTIGMSGQMYSVVQTIAAYRGMVYTITYTAEAANADAHIDDYFAMLDAFDFRGND